MQSPDDSGSVDIVQGYAKTYLVDLFYADTGEPFDLTSATAIVAAHPGTSGTPVLCTLAASEVSVVGAAGAGKIQVALSAAKSAQCAINPSLEQNQDLQVVVTKSAVATPFLLQAVLNIQAPPYGVQ